MPTHAGEAERGPAGRRCDGGNPFATIDFPLIFFVPDPAAGFAHAAVEVAFEMAGLKKILSRIRSQGYILQLNPAWSIPLH